MENITGHVMDRSCNKRPLPYSNNCRKKWISEANCAHLRENVVNIPSVYNKIFASTWVNRNCVVIGTKCNKLVEINMKTKEKREIPLIRSPHPREVPDTTAGVHSISINPSRSFMATGGLNVNDLALYTLPDYQPYAIGEFHQGWLFGISWINDVMLLTGSRDGNIALWTLLHVDGYDKFEAECGIYRKTPIDICKAKEVERIRDTYYNPYNQKLASIGYGKDNEDAKMCILDVKRLSPLHNRVLPLPHYEENVVVSGHAENNVFAVGSLKHLMLIDDRDPKTHDFTSIKNLGHAQGIRSLSFQENTITIGASGPNLFFYDIRSRSYLHDALEKPIEKKTTPGFVLQNHQYHIFRGQHRSVDTSIMTHCYDDSGMRLFAAGGPLALTLFGNYAAVWE